jgi:hypothetical protein
MTAPPLQWRSLDYAGRTIEEPVDPYCTCAAIVWVLRTSLTRVRLSRSATMAGFNSTGVALPLTFTLTFGSGAEHGNFTQPVRARSSCLHLRLTRAPPRGQIIATANVSRQILSSSAREPKLHVRVALQRWHSCWFG